MQQTQQVQGPEAILLRAAQHRRRVIEGATAEYVEVSPAGNRSLVMFRMTEAPGAATAESLKHGGDECFLLLAGTHGVDVAGKRYTMEPGDVIFIPRGLAHRGWNAGSEPVEALFVLSPPDYVEQESREATAQREVVFIRPNERRSRAGAGGVATYEDLSPPGLASMLLIDVRMGQGAIGTHEVRHGGDENLVCLSGAFEFVVEGVSYELGPGDSIFTPRGKRHFIPKAFAPSEAIYAICPGRYS